MQVFQRMAFGLMVLVTLGACGDADSGPSPSTSRLAVTGSVDVAELLGTPVSDDDVRAEFELIHSRIEELTTSCMVDAGFEYQPAPFQSSAGQPVLATASSLGIADQYFGAFSADFEAPPTNPNQAIVQALSDDESAAYSLALQGESLAFDPRFETAEAISDGSAGQGSSRGGCQFESQRTALVDTGRNQALIDQYILLRTGMFQTDRRLGRARVEWATCMAEAGFTYRDEPAMRADVGGQALAVLQDLVELRDQGLQMEPMQDPPPEAAALIDPLRAEEAKVAQAHDVCRVSIDDAISAVSADANEIFLDRNS